MNSPQAEHCSRCGSPLDEDVEWVDAEPALCATCGATLLDEEREYCSKCGVYVGTHVDAPNQLSLFDPAQDDLHNEQQGGCGLGSIGGDERENDRSADLTFATKQGKAKRAVAVVIGVLVGIVLHIALAIPLLWLLDWSWPDDVSLLLVLFTAFVGAAVTGALVSRHGWFFGCLTQALNMLGLGAIAGLWMYLIATDSETTSLPLLVDPEIRRGVFLVVAAVIGGYLGERHRRGIWSFLSSMVVLIGSALLWLPYLGGLCSFVYFVYLGGKAIFEDGAILKGLLVVLILGPVLSYGSVIFGSMLPWLARSVLVMVHDWYALDYGFERLADEP